MFSEIYNEEIRDLLATEKGLKYDIKKLNAKSNDIYVTNLKIEDVTNGSENIKVLLKRAQKNRAVAATNCNERSSRSHSVFMLKIIGNNSVTSESCTGMYPNFIAIYRFRYQKQGLKIFCSLKRK